MEREEIRAASSTLSPRANGGGDWGSTRLPLLCARPGNVGVQIDSYRSMKSMFNRPRCGQFTAHFLGYTFENASMDNYQRVVERTAQRAKILEAKLGKLREHEQRLVDDETHRKRRRQEREVARQRRLWQQLQSMKRQDQRAQEASAALEIQRRTRGMLARQLVAALKRQRAEQRASDVLRRTLTTYALRCRWYRKQTRMKREAAAAVLQRQVRSFVRGRRAREAETPALATDAPLDEVAFVLADLADCIIAMEEDAVFTTSEAALDLSPSLMARDISLDLLFSDDEGDEDPPAALVLTPFTPRPPPPATARPAPKRPARVKRVGGGFRPSAGASSPPPPVARRRRVLHPHAG